MNFYKRNVVAGGVLFIAAALLAMSIGMNFDIRFPAEYDGYYMIKKGDAMIRASHTHGMPFALYNLILAFIIPFLGFSDKMKNIVSWCGVLMIAMPIALLLRGTVSDAFQFLGLIGVLFFLATSVLLIIGAIKAKKQ